MFEPAKGSQTNDREMIPVSYKGNIVTVHIIKNVVFFCVCMRNNWGARSNQESDFFFGIERYSSVLYFENYDKLNLYTGVFNIR